MKTWPRQPRCSGRREGLGGPEDDQRAVGLRLGRQLPTDEGKPVGIPLDPQDAVAGEVYWSVLHPCDLMPGLRQERSESTQPMSRTTTHHYGKILHTIVYESEVAFCESSAMISGSSPFSLHYGHLPSC